MLLDSQLNISNLIREGNVGGFADRIKGATTVMLLSIALGKRFEIDWKYPFDIKEVFVCVDYDWTVKDPESRGQQTSID